MGRSEVNLFFVRHQPRCFAFFLQISDPQLSDAKLVKEIGVTRRKEFDKPKEPYDIVRLFGENVVTARDNDGEWKRHRLAYTAPILSLYPDIPFRSRYPNDPRNQ